MSEKLAVLGRLGAEELADVLNLLFSALLADAAAYGGSLLKYGGDAVLLFFEGEDHAARAAAATHRMRATLRRVGTVKTSRGTVRVRMSVGIHSGEFDFFLVGGSHRELIVTGPGATETCDMETAADAGQILLSPSTAELLAPSCVGERRGDGYLLKRIPRTPAREPLAWGRVPDADPTPFIPVGLRNHVGGVGADAEHRHIAVGFVAFGGVDDLLASAGGEHTAEVLDEFIRSCQDAFDRYDVCFLYADVYGNGGKVFFLSGAPVSHEDNEERALRAALEISSRHYEGLHLHTGLNRGYVFAGDIGAQFRRTYTVLGDAVNTAARVMASCNEDNQVRTMPEVLELASSRFASVAQKPFAAKGKALPLETLAVGEPLGPRLADTPLPLVARDEEMIELRGYLDATEQGRGALLHVIGEPGIGKSRLVEELRLEADARGFATVTTFAERYERTTAYFVLRQLLNIIFDGAENDPSRVSSIGAELAPREKHWLPLLGRVLGIELADTPETAGLDDEAVPRMLGRLVVGLLDGFLSGPSMWVAENAHLIDDASAKVISEVADELHSRQWFLVAVARTGEPVALSDAHPTFTVPRLSDDGATRLARSANSELMPHAASEIATRADGNPLFLRQLVAAAAEGGELSDSVETTVASRIDALAPVDRDVLRTAAVLGGRFELGDLRELLDGRNPDLGRLHDFLTTTDDGSIVFRQALYREVAYAGLTFRRRRALHLAAGRLLQQDGITDMSHLGRLSLHFHIAQAWDASWTYSCKVGEDAFLSVAKSVAATFFERALEAGRKLENLKPERLAHISGRLGQSYFHAGRIEEAFAAYRQGRRFTRPASVERALLDLFEGAVFLDRAEVSKAARIFARGLAALEAAGEDGPGTRVPDTTVPILVGLAQVRLRLGRVDEAVVYGERANAVAQASDDPSLEATAYNAALGIAFAKGDYVAALEAGRAAVEAERLADKLYSGSIAVQLMNLGVLTQLIGDWDGAAALYAEAYETQHLLGMDGAAALSQINLAELRIDQGRWDDARALLDDAQPVVQSADLLESAVFARVLRARLHFRTGDYEGVELPEPTVTLGLPELLHAVRTEWALARGDAEAAAAELEAAGKAEVDLALRPVFEAVIARLRGDRVQTDVELDDALAGVLMQVLQGTAVDDVDDAMTLGVIDVPRWVRPS